MEYSFANILFSGRCNAQCPYCIGKTISARYQVDNLGIFPLLGLSGFVEKVQRYSITEISLTGTNTDPSLYRYEQELIAYLRANIPGVKLSLHTNGRLLVQRNTFNLYDRMSISIPSFIEETYAKMMGVPGVIDLQKIVEMANIPIKISCIVDEQNQAEIPDFLEKCNSLGMKRIVFRRLFGSKKGLKDMIDTSRLEQTGEFQRNSVYRFQGMEITFWDFSATDCKSINLFSNGEISESYILAA